MFFTGIIKYLFVPLAMTVAFAMLADYVVSMSVTPVMLGLAVPQVGHGKKAEEEFSSSASLGAGFVMSSPFTSRCCKQGVRFKALVIADSRYSLCWAPACC